MDDSYLQQQLQQDELSDDDNAAPDMQEEEEIAEKEDPFKLALDDLEGRVAIAINDVKCHPGVRSSGGLPVHEELATMLRPVVEVAAHTAPSIARSYYSGGPDGVEVSCDEVYDRVVSDLVLPFMLEISQSDTIPAKRSASLEFFHNFWTECQKAGSWLDSSIKGAGQGQYFPPNLGPYGSGSTSGHSSAAATTTPVLRAQQKRRTQKRTVHESEILRYWIKAASYCTVPGVFTSNVSEDAVSSRGVIAASASLRPALRHICRKIQDADDKGAVKLYIPCMKMVEGVFNKLFATESGEGVRSACLKFLEIVAVCCSSRGQSDSRRRSKAQNSRDFSIEDLPEGHPIITREALESIAEYAMSTLRGLVTMGGQVKIDNNLMSDVMVINDGLPSTSVVNILKPAALSYLALLESSIAVDEDQQLEMNIGRSNAEYEFMLSQKSYSLAINAVSMLAVNRPDFFEEAATCLARRAADPPVQAADSSESGLSKSGSLAVTAHLKATCLTLLRNPLSVTRLGSEILHKALVKHEMTQQADKALAMARQAAALKTAGRAARNRAQMFYEWDASEQTDKRTSKRSRETDDALSKMRAAKKARGLGNGIQLPSSLVDAVELILLNLKHLPSSRPTGGANKNRKRPITFDYVVDAVMTNGASLAEDEGRWYERDGGNCWVLETGDGDTHNKQYSYKLDEKILLAAEIGQDKTKKVAKEEISDKNAAEELPKIFRTQCQTAASQALNRILKTTTASHDNGMIDFGNQVAAKLAWTLRNVKPSSDLKISQEIASESIHRVGSKVLGEQKKSVASSPENECEGGKENNLTGIDLPGLEKFVEEYPLVAACLAKDLTPNLGATSSTLSLNQPSTISNPSHTLATSVLNEAYMQSCDSPRDVKKLDYLKAFDIFAATVVYSSDQANSKANDAEKKRVATLGTSAITQDLGILPYVPPSSLRFLAGLCDIEGITKKALEAGRKSSSQTIAASAAINAGKMSAEKRATAALVAIRDVAFQRSKIETRRAAVDCAVSIAAGLIPSSSTVEDKALKLVMNVLFPKNENLRALVVEAAISSLERAAEYSIRNYDKIKQAKKTKSSNKDQEQGAAMSDEEKAAIEKVKKPTLLFMALCVREPDMMKQLMQQTCRPQADLLSTAVRESMPKLTRALAAKHGSAAIALQVAELAGEDEIPMLLAFLDNLTPVGDRNLPQEDLIEACYKIQESKISGEGEQDPRFIIPVVTGIKRVDLEKKLPEFVLADDNIFMAALEQMGSRLTRHALIYRDEPDEENPVLTGMTLCEIFVCLHRMDFTSAGIPQKRYLDAVRLCLEDEEIFTDTVVREALDYISGTFLAEDVNLPLAYMRTIILTCSKHESLHNWICHMLLPRLIEGKVYSDRRQWEGWMRCARMLETAGVDGIQDAINKLPPEQLELYRTKYPPQ
mmetsp:Transcript_22021/g.32529  ORF Transcript_22021/g.32529 Transcript_22021/m.32529 type:complete len:1424 (-) Transcript_22021:54-4325(-)